MLINIALLISIMKIQNISGVHIPRPESYKDSIELIRSDYYRYTGVSDASVLRMFIYTFKSPVFKFNFWLRMASYETGDFRGGVFKILKILTGRKRGLMISENTPIGYGLYISHGFGIIVNPTAVIGNNCVLSQFTTIGAMKGKAAVVGDDVYIGPSVCIVEDVHIGNGSVIGAGAVVVKDVPSNTTVAGVPAKVVSHNNSINYILNRYKVM